eukprot:366130-Chlamydomonas_euryale.AAC.66
MHMCVVHVNRHVELRSAAAHAEYVHVRHHAAEALLELLHTLGLLAGCVDCTARRDGHAWHAAEVLGERGRGQALRPRLAQRAHHSVCGDGQLPARVGDAAASVAWGGRATAMQRGGRHLLRVALQRRKGDLVAVLGRSRQRGGHV